MLMMQKSSSTLIFWNQRDFDVFTVYTMLFLLTTNIKISSHIPNIILLGNDNTVEMYHYESRIHWHHAPFFSLNVNSEKFSSLIIQKYQNIEMKHVLKYFQVNESMTSSGKNSNSTYMSNHSAFTTFQVPWN